jgi:hypothetical protein
MKISIFTVVILISNLFSINTYSQDIDLDCDCDYVIDDSDDDWPTGNLNNKTICLSGNFTYNKADWEKIGNNGTLCIGEGVTFNSQGLRWPNSGNNLTLNNYGNFNHGTQSTILIKNNSVINNYGTLTTVVKLQNGTLNSYDGATTNLVGGGTNFDSGLINVYTGSVLNVNSGSYEQMGNGFTLNNEGSTTFEDNLANSNGSINSSGTINFSQKFRNDSYANISGDLTILGDLESNSNNAELIVENSFIVNGDLKVWSGKIAANAGFEIIGSTVINSTGTIQFGEEIIFNNLTSHAGLIESSSGCNKIILNGEVAGWGGRITANNESAITIPSFSEIPPDRNWVFNGTVGIEDCTPEPTVWIGVVSTDAENINNWSNGFPDRNSDIVINITPNDPIFSENVEIKNLLIANGASVSQTNESQIDIYGDFENNGTYNPGNSTLAFKGAGIQNFSTNNTISVYNLTIDNGHSLNLVSGNVDIFNSLNLTTGDLITNYDHSIPGNNLVTFKSNATNTAIISKIENGNTIIGEVMIERYITMQNRAFRFITTSVNTTTSINENWQEGVNNTVNDYTENKDPNPGYGTHITGSTTGANGLDATPTGNPSLFSWDSQNGSWSTISNTNTNTLEAGKAYGILIRGDRGTNMYLNNLAKGDDTRLRSLGTILTGDVNIDNDLNPNSDGFALIGNPYQAEVDMKATLKNSSTHLGKRFYYAYKPSIGDRGGYVTVDLDSEPVEHIPEVPLNNNMGPQKFRFLQVNQAVFVQTDENLQQNESPSLTFKEEYKTDQTSTNEVLRINSNSKIDLNIFSISNEKLMDGVRFKFDTAYDEEAGPDDALKFWNDDETIGIQSDGKFLAIEKRPFPKDEDVFSFWIGNYRDADYTMNVEVEGMPDYDVFLRDTYTEVDHQLNEGENDIAFSIDSSIPASVNSDRFKIRFKQVTLGTSQNEMTASSQLYPNPSNSGFAYLKHNPDFNNELKVSVFNILGQNIEIPKDRVSSSELKLNTSSLNSGIYLVKLTYQTQTTTHKLIVE